MAQTVKRLPTMRETWVQSLGREDLLEKEMATHSSILAWKILWTDEPGRLQSMGSQRVGHDWATSLHFTVSRLPDQVVSLSVLNTGVLTPNVFYPLHTSINCFVWLDSITNSMDMNLSKLQEVMEDRGAQYAAVHGVIKNQTQLSNWTARNIHNSSKDIIMKNKYDFEKVLWAYLQIKTWTIYIIYNFSYHSSYFI